MYFKKIKLKSFRNYAAEDIEFNKHMNIFIGNNAQGKTNLLESLFVMGLAKSFRTNRDQDMIAFGEKRARVKSLVCKESPAGIEEDTEIEITYSQNGKLIKVNGIRLAKTMDMLENVFIVIFSPEDMKTIKEGPQNRRRFIDRELCQIKPIYYINLANYKKVLRQRNALIKQGNRDYDLIRVYDEALSKYGTQILEEREDFIKKIGEISNRIHSEISGKKENLQLTYESTIPKCETAKERKENFFRDLHEGAEKDFVRGYTSIGPHRDDIRIEVNDTDLRYYGSQGQQRTAALSMKLSEIELIKEETGENAVLLMDDVLSELDAKRKKYLLNCISDTQVFITATEIPPELSKSAEKGYVFEIEGGKVKRLT